MPAEAFAGRLRSLMVERGHISRLSRSGVDIKALAAAADTSYEMARRYAEGLAVPRAEKLLAIAQWLGVSPSSLQWGRDQAQAVDTGVLESCMRAVTEAQQRTGRPLSIEQAARLVALLYDEAVAGRLPTPEAVDLLLRGAV